MFVRCLFICPLLPSLLLAAPPSSEAIEFFEKQIRPLLLESCVDCHGPKKQNAGLRLDTREGFFKGSDSGPIAVAGDPAKSLLIKVVRYETEAKMPPKKKLSDAQIAALETWVKMGLPWPEAQKSTVSDDSWKKHWAFQPVRSPAIPSPKTPRTTPIDRLVQSKLEEKGLNLSPEADRRSLIRRITYDLTGLLATAEEVEDFVQDKSPDAFSRRVDQLLASPHFGEHMARFWMDLARYSDTKGYVFTEDRNYPYAYTYRDWLIQSFNEDLPYDKFIRYQLAADREKVEPRHLAAMGFLTVGRRFLNNQPDIIDDRIDVSFRTFMGLTVTCSRCHDHKYDPIPINDYYSLYGVFASSVEPKDLPLIAPPMNTAENKAFEDELKKRETAAQQAWEKLRTEALAKISTSDSLTAYLSLYRDSLTMKKDQALAVAAERKLSAFLFDRYREYFVGAAKEATPFFNVFSKLGALPDASFANQSADTLKKALAEPTHPAIRKAFEGKSLTSFKQVAEIYGQLLSQPDGDVKAVNFFGPFGPLSMNDKQLERLISIKEKNVVRDLRRSVDQWKTKSPASPARAMVMNDADKPTNPYVFKRGNPGNRGPDVPRQFLGFVSADRKPFSTGSGRQEMASAIADPKNPLTARVLVNRLWLNLFGAGLVRTPSDFGLRADPPTHPELLDYLAGRLVSEGWSIKKLIREIVLSQTYQQSSAVNADLARNDPENRLLARMNRKRMTFEALRDALLQSSGKLDGSVGGKSVDIFAMPFVARRSVYAFIDRQNLPGTFRSFDVALPDTHAPQRFTTTVPQQALYLMNNPFVVEQARTIAEKAKTVDDFYRMILGRLPNAEEREFATEFMNLPSEPLASSPWSYGTGTFNAMTRQLTFTSLPTWTGTGWQGGAQLPDPKLGWCLLTAQGGHPGNPLAVIRRFTVPADGQLTIEGQLGHTNTQGDGVRARLIAQQKIEGEWKAKNSKADTPAKLEVKAGQTVDFVVDCLADENSDSFTWMLKLKLKSQAKETTYDSSNDFRGPSRASSLNGREQFAQVLLLSNEFCFID